MAWVPAAIAAAQAISSYMANRKGKSDSSFASNESYSGSETPIVDEQTRRLIEQMSRQYYESISKDPVGQEYTVEGLKNINQGADLQSAAMNRILAARGLGRTTAGGYASAFGEANRIGQTSSFLNNLPLLRQQMMQQNLAGAAAFQRGVPFGRNMSGTSSRSGYGNQTTAGNPAGGAASGLSASLAWLYGQGAFNQNNANLSSSDISGQNDSVLNMLQGMYPSNSPPKVP